MRILKTWAMIALALLTTGCVQEEGSVAVDVGQAPLAVAYRVDLYAREAGMELVDGVYVSGRSVATLDDVPAGKWSLLIQAQNGDHTTIGYYQAVVEVFADRTTEIVAGTYRPGMPGDPLPETSAGLTSFGPNGDALFSALYAPDIDSLPQATVDLELSSGEGTATSNRQSTLSRALESGAPQCGTCFISAQDVEQGNQLVRQRQDIRAQFAGTATGGTADFFIVTTFQTVTCRRLLTDAQTEHCLIFAELVNGNPVISEATALQVAQGFDSDNPFQDGDGGIYGDTRTRMGSEWITDGGRDGDTRVALVFLSPSSIGGSGLFGFFNPADQKSSAENASSNEGEILYLNAERAEADVYDALGTIAHEFVHLIIYNQKVAQEGTFPSGASPENAVMDEGLAVLNEELSGFTYTGDQGGNFFLLSAVSQLLDQGINRRYFQFGGQLADYGAGYLFWRYVHDQFGLQTVTDLATSTNTGRANFDSVLNEPFYLFFQRYTQALALNNQTGLPGELMFDNLDLFGTYPSREGTVFELNGLQGISSVTLPGTLTTSLDVEPWGTVFYRADGGDGSAVNWMASGVQGLSVDVVPLENAQ